MLDRSCDYSGVPVLIDDIASADRIDGTYISSIARALAAINAPDTREQLNAFFKGAVDTQVRLHTLAVIARLGDADYLPLLRTQIDANEEQIRRAAGREIATTESAPGSGARIAVAIPLTTRR